MSITRHHHKRDIAGAPYRIRLLNSQMQMATRINGTDHDVLGRHLDFS